MSKVQEEYEQVLEALEELAFERERLEAEIADLERELATNVESLPLEELRQLSKRQAATKNDLAARQQALEEIHRRATIKARIRDELSKQVREEASRPWLVKIRKAEAELIKACNSTLAEFQKLDDLIVGCDRETGVRFWSPFTRHNLKARLEYLISKAEAEQG